MGRQDACGTAGPMAIVIQNCFSTCDHGIIQNFDSWSVVIVTASALGLHPFYRRTNDSPATIRAVAICIN